MTMKKYLDLFEAAPMPVTSTALPSTAKPVQGSTGAATPNAGKTVRPGSASAYVGGPVDATAQVPDTSAAIPGTGSKMVNDPTKDFEESMQETADADLAEMMRLSGLQLNEKAVSKQQQKFMGMVHAMQKGEKVKGASPELKKVAKTMGKKDAKDFANTKHKGLPQKVSEGVNFVEMMRETEQTLEEMLTELHDEITEFKMTGHMGDKLRDAMELHRHSKNKLMGEANMVYEDDALNELAALAGLEEDGPGAPALYSKESTADKMQSGADTVKDFFTKGAEAYKDLYMTGLGMPPDKYTPADPRKPFGPRKSEVKEQDLEECGEMSMSHDKDSINVSTNMSSDGTKNVTVSAEGDQAEALMQMLKLAGMGGSSRPAVAMIDTDEKMMEKEETPVPDDGNVLGGLGDFEQIDAIDEAKKKRITRHSNTPDEKYQTVDSILRQGADLNREKRQYKKEYPGDNPMAESMLDSDLNDILESILIRDDDTPAKLLFTPKSIDPETGSDLSGYDITSPRTGRVGARMEPGKETEYYAADPLAPDDVTGATIKNHGEKVEWHRGEKGVDEQSGNQPNPYPVGQDALTPQQKLNPTNNPNKSIVQGIKDFIMNPLKPGM